MVEIDPLTGLPKELLAMEEIVREQQSIKVHIEKRRYGKLVTVIDGIGKGVDINDLAKQLKTKCATGGTSKGGVIELQGDHTKKVNEDLSDKGFPVEVQKWMEELNLLGKTFKFLITATLAYAEFLE